MRQGTTDAVPLCSLVSEHAEVGIAYVIYHVIRCGHVEAITEPIDCHLSRCHGVKHEVLQVLQGLGIGKECFVHVYTIHDLGCCAYFVCHLVNCLGRLTSLYHLTGKFLQTASHKMRVNSSWVSGYFPSHISQQNVSTIESMSSMSCSRCINISSIGLGTKLLLLFMLVISTPEHIVEQLLRITL